MTKKPRRHSVSIYMDVDVPIDDVLDEMSDDELLSELESRNKKPAPTYAQKDLVEIYECLLRKDFEEAIIIIHSLVYPKFKSVSDCTLALSKTKGSA